MKNSKRKMQKKNDVDERWLNYKSKKMFILSRLLIKTRIIIIRLSSFVTRLKKKKNRKTTFVVSFFFENCDFKKSKKNRKKISFFFFFSIMLFSIKKKKNQRTIFVNFFLDQVSSSLSLSSSFINFKSRFVTQSFRLFSSSIFKKIAILLNALIKKRRQSFKNLFKKKIFNKIISWFLFFDFVHVEIVIWRISLTNKSSKNDFVNIKKTRQIVKRIVRMRYVNKITRNLNTSQSYQKH
jgi:hypothetical protein